MCPRCARRLSCAAGEAPCGILLSTGHSHSRHRHRHRLQAFLRSSPLTLANVDERVKAVLLGPVEGMQSLLRQQKTATLAHEAEERRRAALYYADPFDPEAQRRIEEEINRVAQHEAYERAMEETPELIAQSTTMLYVPVHANGVAIQAFVDSGAQMTIMSSACAERSGLMRLVDKRFAGMAVGVGTQKILGRIVQVVLQIGGSFLPCSLSVMGASPVCLWVTAAAG